MRVKTAVTAAGVVVCFTIPALASAGAPVIERFSDTIEDVFFCRGGPLEISIQRDMVAQCLPNRSAFAVHVNWMATITNPATGFSVDDPGAWTEEYQGVDYPGGTCPENLFAFPLPETQSIRGSIYHLTIPGEGIAVLDAGVITIDIWTGEILLLGGPHDALLTGVDICEIMGADECPAGTIEDCWGGCTPEEFLGDGACDPMLWCPETDFDAGDCCAWGEIEDCEGNCVPEEDLFSSWGNGTCDDGLDCLAFWYDFGDCQCGEGTVDGCYEGCFPDYWIGDGICDPDLDCEANDFDLGDCDGGGGCGPDQVEDCLGGCTFEGWIGDDICDPSLNCDTFNFDEGDCDGSGG